MLESVGHHQERHALGDGGFAELLRTHKPTAVDVHMEPQIGAMVGARVPVLRDGKIKYVLTAAIEPALFGNILTRQKLAEGSLGVVSDRNRIIVAASLPGARRTFRRTLLQVELSRCASKLGPGTELARGPFLCDF